jgi:hypothetical protein
VEKLGVPIVEGADYLSPTLWTSGMDSFYGLLFDRTKKADSLFRATEERYLALKELVSKTRNDQPFFLRNAMSDLVCSGGEKVIWLRCTLMGG